MTGTDVSDVKVTLPANAGRTEVEITAGAANIDIAVPDGVAVRIDADTLLSSTSIDSFRFPEVDGLRQSPNYASAENQVDIEIYGSAARVRVASCPRLAGALVPCRHPPQSEVHPPGPFLGLFGDSPSGLRILPRYRSHVPKSQAL